MWRVQLFTPGTVNTICIRLEQVQRSANHWVVASVIDYCSESCLISRITVYSSHTFAVPSTGSVDNYNVLTDISMRFFGNWTSSLDTSYRGGTELCMLGMRSGMGNRMRMTYIPSKGDRQFVFGATTGDPSDYTANELVWITQESGVPTEVVVLDFTATAVEWKPGIGQIKQFNFVEKNNMLYVKPKKSVPFDKLADGVCLFSFACYNSCLEHKNDSYRKGKLIKSGLQVLFTLLDGNRTVLREDSVDLRVCAFSTQDIPFNSCHGNSHHPTSNAQTRQRGTKHHRVHRLKKQHYKQQQQQQSWKFLVQQAQDDQIKDDLKTEGGMM